MAGAVAAAAQVTELGGAADLLASGRARDVSDAGRQRLKDRIEAPHGSFRPSDHHAIAALQAPDAATGSDIHIIDAFRSERVGAQDVVDVIGVATVDEDVAAFEVRYDFGDRLVDRARRNHQPDRPRLLKLAHEFCDRGRSDRALLCQIFDRLPRHVEDHALMAASEQPSHHIGAHSSQANHCKLHDILLHQSRVAARSRSMAEAMLSPSVARIDGASVITLVVTVRPSGCGSGGSGCWWNYRGRAWGRSCSPTQG